MGSTGDELGREPRRLRRSLQLSQPEMARQLAVLRRRRTLIGMCGYGRPVPRRFGSPRC
jgi:hypothetical protein